MTDIVKYDFKAGLPVEFEIIDMRQLFDANKDILTATHRIGFYNILWFTAGRATHLVDFQPVDVAPETILFLNQDSVQRFDPKGNFDGKIIVFTDTFFSKTAADAKYLKSTILFNDLFSTSLLRLPQGAPLLHQYLDLMQTELSNPTDALQPELLKNLLHTFLLLAERERRTQDFTELRQSPDLDVLLQFREALEENYHQQKQVGVYAQSLNITEKRLAKATVSLLGKTPKQMIDDRVMLEAKRLLAHSNLNVKEIGFDLGFGEPTNFIKYFRRLEGQTPAEFRASHALA
jgi:AraC family transcriptional activator of pobA